VRPGRLAGGAVGRVVVGPRPAVLGRHDVDGPLEHLRRHGLDELHELDLLAPLLGEVFELRLPGLRGGRAPGAAVPVVAGAEDDVVGALAELVVVTAEVEAGEVKGLGEGVVEDGAAGAGAEAAVVRVGGQAADLLRGDAQLAGDDLPRRPLGAQLGGAGEAFLCGVMDRRDHDGDRGG
jgi:hypothetical protein